MNFQLASRKLPLSSTPARIYEALFITAPYAFWLDSSRHDTGQARFSFLGAGDGPESYRVEGFVGRGTTILRAAKEPEELEDDVFKVTEQHLASMTVTTDQSLPFDFNGGFVGYLGYELMEITEGVPGHPSMMADAALLFVDRFLAADHTNDELYLVALHRGDATGVEAWFSYVEDVLRTLPASDRVCETRPPLLRPSDIEPFLLHDKTSYLNQIAVAKQQILKGESYEICLTNRVRVPLSSYSPADIFNTYLALREINPAPYACLLHFGQTSVLCSSPERFLKITPDGMVETKPIKGTTRRSADKFEDESNRQQLLDDEKFFSENLMIVDLLRNDLTRSCVAGSVHVPSLMHVESYATVHQLVSTIRGTLEQSPVGCVARCFPGGSMTGAPKKRTLEIIDSLEQTPRGIYSGAIGYLSLNGGVDLNIVIRTAVINENIAEIGVGGAIIHLSDAQEEYDEMLLKALAPFSAIALLAAPGTEEQEIKRSA
ncbi:anthranilate synthase component I family protein [Granulicella mallensis]|uniref:Aminodeoxychorismate synthase n=1 Tax=Granulicella mallensis (strain ATCC BAA-1857 / DSM 23137 / MP5ACTX8) TaxID=682795 RepID=G8NU13_GRAMM|nr:anthranilate synthase component I family protein [Granulicella mallensis]AEU37569.1 Aminodeoxychorismate synthase [Granulicella mallensis MP5ACTX8]